MKPSRSHGGNRNGTSRFRGVRLLPNGRWGAHVMVRKRQHHLGSFDTEEEAAEAARAFRRKHMPFSVADQP